MSLLPFLVIFNTTKVGFHSIKEVENLPKKLSQYQRKHFFIIPAMRAIQNRISL